VGIVEHRVGELPEIGDKLLRCLWGGRPVWHGAWYARPGVAFGAGAAAGAVGAAIARPGGGLLWPKCGCELMA
jgi:hypothetical protein